MTVGVSNAALSKYLFDTKEKIQSEKMDLQKAIQQMTNVFVVFGKDENLKNAVLQYTQKNIGSDSLLYRSDVSYHRSLIYMGETCVLGLRLKPQADGLRKGQTVIARRIDTIKNIDICSDYRAGTTMVEFDRQETLDSLMGLYNLLTYRQYRQFYNLNLDNTQEISNLFQFKTVLPDFYELNTLGSFLHLLFFISQFNQLPAPPTLQKNFIHPFSHNIVVKDTDSIILNGFFQNVQIENCENVILCGDIKNVKIKNVKNVLLSNCQNMQIYKGECAEMYDSHDVKCFDFNYIYCSASSFTAFVKINYAIVKNTEDSSFKNTRFLHVEKTIGSKSNGCGGLCLYKDAKILQNTISQAFITMPQSSFLETSSQLQFFQQIVPFDHIKLLDPTTEVINLNIRAQFPCDPSFVIQSNEIYSFNSQGEWTTLQQEPGQDHMVLNNRGEIIELSDQDINYENGYIEIQNINEINLLQFTLTSSQNIFRGIKLNGVLCYPNQIIINVQSDDFQIFTENLEKMNIILYGTGHNHFTTTVENKKYLNSLYFYNIDYEFTGSDVRMIRQLQNINFLINNLKKYDFEANGYYSGLFANMTLGNIKNSHIKEIPESTFFNVNWQGEFIKFENVKSVGREAFKQLTPTQTQITVYMPKVEIIEEYAFQNLGLITLQREERYNCQIYQGSFKNTGLKYFNFINCYFPLQGHIILSSPFCSNFVNNMGNNFGILSQCKKLSLYNIDSFSDKLINVPAHSQGAAYIKNIALLSDGQIIMTSLDAQTFDVQALISNNPLRIESLEHLQSLICINQTHPVPMFDTSGLSFVEVEHEGDLTLGEDVHGISITSGVLTANFEIYGYKFFAKKLVWNENVECKIVVVPVEHEDFSKHGLIFFNTSIYNHQISDGKQKKITFQNARKVCFDEDIDWDEVKGSPSQKKVDCYCSAEKKDDIEAHWNKISSQGVNIHVLE